ncbi:transposase [Streptomyces sp. NPDC052236]|uniref:transposase n=1 Tax=Streptomyces sp. NPDC052236 TaxID=3365686 RepID=UPI0037D94AA1
MLMRDRLDVVFEDEEFADLYPKDGRPGLSPGQLALVSVLQFSENLSDRAAANAVRTRIDWKYALGLELDDPGFDHSVLCEFRARLAEGDAADRLLQVMLHDLVEAGLLKSGGRQRTDATHVLAAVRTLRQLELVGESLRAALEQLAQAAPDWLLGLVEPEWDKRYGRKVEIGKVPGGKAGVTALAEAFGRDGRKVLAAAWATDAPPRLRALTQVEILRQVWVHHYYWDARGRLRWRDGRTLPPASLRFDPPMAPTRTTASSGTPPDPATEPTSPRHARQACRRWSCTWPPRSPRSRTANSPPQIHDDLAAIDLTPAEHAVDADYVSPAQIERARRVHGIALLGPVVPDHSHQAKSGAGFDKAAFAVDWDHCRATCPQGAASRERGPLHISGHDYIQVKFDKATCLACPVGPQCTDAVSGPRSLALLPTRELHEIQMHNRLDQRTEDWQRRYAIRAGIEATLSQNVRTYGLRRTRYRGLPKTHVQHVLTGLACNVTRITDWITDP